MKRLAGAIIAICALLAMTGAVAADIVVTVHRITGQGVHKAVGTITFRDSKFGLIVIPNLKGLQPGLHGTHIHKNPSCGTSKHNNSVVPGGAAGGHYDPNKTGKHQGPYGAGHLGDLPNLIVESDGGARLPVLAPRLKEASIAGHSVMMHAGVDRYAMHHHHHHGKGGGRAYCGVIPAAK